MEKNIFFHNFLANIRYQILFGIRIITLGIWLRKGRNLAVFTKFCATVYRRTEMQICVFCFTQVMLQIQSVPELMSLHHSRHTICWHRTSRQGTMHS